MAEVTEKAAGDSPDPGTAGTALEAAGAQEAPEAAPPPPPQTRRGFPVAAGLVLGGALAAALGFVAARSIVPEGWPFPGVPPEPDPLALAQAEQAGQLAQLRQQAEALAAQLAGIEAELEAGRGRQAEARAATAGRIGELQAALATSERRLETLETSLAALSERLLEVEKLPPGAGAEAAEAAAAAYRRELAALRETLTRELARIEAASQAAAASDADARAEAEAEAESRLQARAQATALRLALAELRGNLEAGKPFAAALDTLARVTDAPPPEALRAAAKSGVAPFSRLRENFPEAARAALAASLDALVADGTIGRLEGFLRRQLGARSLQPRPGDDPDAVLSRAEAALGAGDLTAALAELEALPDAGRAAMADWIVRAETRRAALAAAEVFAAGLDLQ